MSVETAIWFLRVSQLITSITLFMVVIELVRTKRQLVDVLELLNVSFDTLNKKIDDNNFKKIDDNNFKKIIQNN